MQTEKHTDSSVKYANTHDVEGDNYYQAQYRKDIRWLWSGFIGGGLVILVLLIFAILKPGFRISAYYVVEDPSLLSELLSTEISEKDRIRIEKKILEETELRKDVIEDLTSQNVIVSSKDFASNLTGYYNTLVAVLAGILIILNIIGFFSWRSNANYALEQKRKQLNDNINNIDKRLEDNLEKIFAKNSIVKEKIESIFGNLYDESSQLTDEECEILHLLLAKYKKEETLREINVQDEQNDGEITE